ncbi:hypothetical protein NN561_013572 [Cricetulus griseus]
MRSRCLRPRVRAPPPSPSARCKMVFTKVNIGHSAAQASRSPSGCPSPGPSRDHQGPLLPSQLTLGLKGYLKARHQQALAKVAEEQQSPTSFLPGA